MQAPIYHFFWSPALVLLKAHIKHFSDQMMKVYGKRKSGSPPRPSMWEEPQACP